MFFSSIVFGFMLNIIYVCRFQLGLWDCARSFVFLHELTLMAADSTHYLHMYACVFIFKDVFIKPRNLCDLVELSAMRALPRDVSWRPKFIQNKNTYKTKIEVEIKSI